MMLRTNQYIMKPARLTRICFAAILFTACLLAADIRPLHAQAAVVKSSRVEQYNGKSYYLHKVEAKQTLYGISRAYGVPVDVLLTNNPDARNGIKINQILRVPAGDELAVADATPAEAQAAVEEVNANDILNEFETIYHVAGRNEKFSYIADIYLVPESNIRLANPTLREPLKEGEYVLVPIARKDKRPSLLSEHQMQRDSYDPFVPSTTTATRQAAKTTSTPPSRSQTTSSSPETVILRQAEPEPVMPRATAANETEKPVQMVSPFEIPSEQNSQASAREAEQVRQSNQAVQQVAGRQHIVKPKETLYSIAAAYAVKPSEILKANPEAENGLQPGQVLLLPESTVTQAKIISTPVVQQDSLVTHIVSRGETLYRISRNYAVSIDELKRQNPGLTNTIKAGQKIMIPKKKITDPFIVHTVEEKERSSKLARNFDITTNELFTINPSIGRKVYPGQKVLIPIADHLEVNPVEPSNEQIIVDKPVETETTVVTETKPNADCASINIRPKQRYRVALMLPLYLEKMDSVLTYAQDMNLNVLRAKPFSFIQFYEGFLLAADSLAKTDGLQLDLYVYDVDASLYKAQDALNDPKLKSVDMIVGPLFSKPFELVSQFAERNNILIVNPMSQRKEIVYNHPNVIKLKPDDKAQYAQLAALLRDRWPDAKVYIYTAYPYKFSEEAVALRNAIESVRPTEVKVPVSRLLNVIRDRSRKMDLDNTLVSSIRIERNRYNTDELERMAFDSISLPNRVTNFVYASDSVREFRKTASVVRENVVIVLSDDAVFSTEFINKMNQVADTFSLTMVGLPHWERFEQLFIENLMKMKAVYFSPTRIDYNDYFTQQFVHQFRTRYVAEPELYAFEGFDLGWYFLQALQRYGSNPQACLPQFRVPLLHTQYFFKADEATDGLENKFWNVYQFSNYERIPLLNVEFTPGR